MQTPAGCWGQQARGATGGSVLALSTWQNCLSRGGEGIKWNPGIQTAGDWKAARMKWNQDKNDQGKKVLH